MKISCITVSVDYADYLEQCVANKQQVSEWLIVTAPFDKKTVKVCEQHNIGYITTNIMYQDAFFAKGKAINHGINLLNPTDWILQLDSDIKLPPDFFQCIQSIELDKNCIYGCKRQFKNKSRIEIDPKTNTKHNRPLIGFFQLWHSSKYKDYPCISTHAGVDDELHVQRYSYPAQWKFLDIAVDDVSGVFCENWYGRKRRWLTCQK